MTTTLRVDVFSSGYVVIIKNFTFLFHFKSDYIPNLTKLTRSEWGNFKLTNDTPYQKEESVLDPC